MTLSARPLGSTGLTVTALGVGLAAIGRPGYINLGRDQDLGPDRSVAELERRCHALLDLAWEAGIRYVDAARSYGHAERFLGSWLAARRIQAGSLSIGSKWGYRYTGNWAVDAEVHEVKDLSLATLRRQIQESRETLNGHLSLYQIHSATIESGVLEDKGVLAELIALRGSGLAIGLTVTGPGQAMTIARAFDVRADGVCPFQVVQATWNLLEPSAGPVLSEARARGWGVILKETLANGRLTDRDAGREADVLRRHAAELGLPLDRLAMAAALSQPWADTVLSGAVRADHLRSHVAALERVPTLGPIPPAAQPPEQYWSRRAGLRWS
jgi:aryl-alcohol dehydrogenase-like predicted oxidoreductase